MILLDAYALVALLAAEPATSEVQRLLRTGVCSVTTTQLAETLDVLVRVLGKDRAAIEGAVDPLLATTLALLELGDPEARLAARIRASHYRKGTAELSLADCVLLATAMPRGATIATSDPPLADAAREEGLTVHGLPDRAGRLP